MKITLSQIERGMLVVAIPNTTYGRLEGYVSHILVGEERETENEGTFDADIYVDFIETDNMNRTHLWLNNTAVDQVIMDAEELIFFPNGKEEKGFDFNGLSYNYEDVAFPYEFFASGFSFKDRERVEFELTVDGYDDLGVLVADDEAELREMMCNLVLRHDIQPNLFQVKKIVNVEVKIDKEDTIYKPTRSLEDACVNSLMYLMLKAAQHRGRMGNFDFFDLLGEEVSSFSEYFLEDEKALDMMKDIIEMELSEGSYLANKERFMDGLTYIFGEGEYAEENPLYQLIIQTIIEVEENNEELLVAIG
ncbi:hypothetical protein [Niallia taxi]|uniref:hypothetical protein n=1 Tax=Niallia taxi TaxID=2499688 RepID=UPI0015F63B5F|nr:hypothetical protein [Niallia taxi]